MRHGDRVRMANFAPAVNARGPLFVHESGIVKRSTYRIFAMYASLLETHALPTSAQSCGLATGDTEVPLVDLVATGNPETGALAIALLNKWDGSEARVQFRIGGDLVRTHADMIILGAPSPDSYNDVGHPDVIQPRKVHSKIADGRLALPPRSVTVVRLDAFHKPTAGLEWTVGTHRHARRELIRSRRSWSPSGRGPAARSLPRRCRTGHSRHCRLRRPGGGNVCAPAARGRPGIRAGVDHQNTYIDTARVKCATSAWACAHVDPRIY
ncbi:alpha-L-arabinofuranosidase C-terminal domain-containing protein [Streptomyces sp. NPDC014892]|uniref:alpha-L-arabinofuranosidase C-terminal domain-containing protein n=1 Tax=Streptomyces sp. NPDC014892 TaxID=3364930 RepID=UPI003700F79E